MHVTLNLPPGCDGQIWQHVYRKKNRAPHSHIELECNLVTRGHAIYLLGERRYDLYPGTLIWLFPSQEHILLYETPDHSMWIGVFSPALLERSCTTPFSAPLRSSDPPGTFCKALRDADADFLRDLMADVEQLTGTPDPARLNAGLGYALLTAWDVFERAGQSAPSRRIHPAVEQAARRLRDDPEAAGLERLAAEAGLSASRLGRLFRAQLGVSVPDFRNAQRIERFLRLYGDSTTGKGRHLSLMEAALEAGWGSYAQFHRVWTRCIGSRPSDFGQEPQQL